MTLYLEPPAGSTVYIPFHTFNSSGASVTISGLAVTDIEIYKNGSVTQRSSDNGYTLLDTDGIDFDGVTGIHGFSIDLSDNSDASFYAVGSVYWVVISAITANAQTVNFVAAILRIRPAEATAGYQAVDAAKWNNLATVELPLVPATAGRKLDVTAANKVNGVVLVDTVTTYTGNTPQTGDSFARIGATGSGLTSLAPSATALSTVQWTNTRAGLIDNVDVAVSTRLATAGYTAPDNSGIGGIKTQTDKFVFDVANQVNANIQYVNNVEVNGTGAVGDEWGP